MKSKLPITFKNSIEIKDIEDFNCVGQDIVFELVDRLAKNSKYHSGYTSEDGTPYFNEFARKLIDNTQRRLGKLASLLFTESDLVYLDLNPWNLLEE